MLRFLKYFASLSLSCLFLVLIPSCSSDKGECPVCPSVPDVKTVKVPAVERGPYYVPDKPTTGDADFAGHGPNVVLRGRVYATGDSLMCLFYVYAVEDGPDWTRGYLTQVDLIYSAPAGWTITAVDTPLFCERTYKDTSHEMDFVDCGEVKFRGYGDCAGEDVGVCTRYWVWFRELTVELARQ